MDYAPRIRLIRQWRDWSCAELAERINVSPRTIEGWEQGRMPSAAGPAAIKHLIDTEA